MTKLTGKYEMKSWDETTLRDLAPPQKCTRVDVNGEFAGAIQGAGQTTYCLAYITADTGTYTGYTHFSGTKDGKAATCVLAEQGIFDKSGAKSTWTIIDGSGTGALQGATGEGWFHATEGMVVDFELNVEFPT